jgi:hypothetical protein
MHRFYFPLIAISILILSSTSFASYIKASGSSGINDYQDYALSAKWKVAKESKILTSVQSTKSSGSTTNEFKVGYDSTISEVTSFDVKGFTRSEPSDVKVIGLETEFSFDYEDLIFEELDTDFSIGLDLSRSSTDIAVGPKKKVTQSFTTRGISIGVGQEILEELKASFTASFYGYTEPQTRFPVGRRRLFDLTVSGAGLSTTGYPEKSFSLGLAWDIADHWSSYYYVSSTKTYFDSLTTIYSGLSLDHTFTDHLSAGVGYNWSSASSSTGSLDATYFW